MGEAYRGERGAGSILTRSTIEAVFFDAGETILHPHPSFSEIFSSVCRGAGYDIDPAAVEEVQGRLAPHLMDLEPDESDDDAASYEASAFTAEGARAFWRYLYRRFLAELGVNDPELVDRLFETFTDPSTYKLFDDVVSVLHELRDAGLTLGLISNFERWLEELLVELEVGHLFDTVTISGVAGIEKPDPAIYSLALREAGVAPSAAVHVGDSPAMDAAPAASVGMHVVLLDRVARYPQSEWPRIESMKELPDLVSKL